MLLQSTVVMRAVYLFFLCFIKHSVSIKLQLKQVLVLSRHNLRSPLSGILHEVTPKTWPEWAEPAGHLTAKGAALEENFGEFIVSWFNVTGVLLAGCPTEQDVFVYANSKQRAEATARAFVKGGFPSCHIRVHHKNSIDSIFEPIIHNNTDTFKRLAYEEMKERLLSVNLNETYELLQKLLDYGDSENCKNFDQCDLVADTNRVLNIQAGFKPNIAGPLKIGKSVVDAFLMENYEGFKVAWGDVTSAKNWTILADLFEHYHSIIFNTPLVAKDIAEPLVNYMSRIFLGDGSPKVTLLFGHDANLLTVIKAMNFKPYRLINTYENCPIGGKIVFQKWSNVLTGKDFLRINYVYQSTSQMRSGRKLSQNNPPQNSILEIEGCAINRNGFCKWDDFENILNNLFDKTEPK